MITYNNNIIHKIYPKTVVKFSNIITSLFQIVICVFNLRSTL
jgi:hypothetical protein